MQSSLSMRAFRTLLPILVLWSFSAWAEIDPMTGGEFNFSGPQLFHIPVGMQSIRDYLRSQYININQQEVRAVNRFAADLFASCEPNCTMTEFVRDYSHVPGAKCYRITYPDGFWFEIMPDLFVVEVIHKPTPVSQMVAQRNRVQAVFNIARLNYLWTHSAIPGLPININHNFDMNGSFENNSEQFLQFFVDYANNLELSEVVGSDVKYAPMFSHLSPAAFTAMSGLIREVVAARMAGQPWTLEQTGRAINERIYTSTTFVRGGTAVPYYNQSFAVKHYSLATSAYPVNPPFELRSPRMPENADEYQLFLNLYKARINYTHNRHVSGEPIIFLHRRQTRFSNQELVDRFYLYVTEAGLRWSDYKGLMVPHLQSRQASNFIRRNWFYSASEARSARAHIEFIATSPVVEQLFREYLVEMPNRQLREDLEQRIYQMSRSHPDAQVKARLTRFIRSQSCHGNFK